MPRGLFKNFAKRTGKTIKEIETLWNNSKLLVISKYPNIKEETPEFYSLVVDLLKKTVGLNKNYRFLAKFKKLLAG